MNHFVNTKLAAELTAQTATDLLGGMRARWITSTSELEAMKPSWQQLIDNSIYRNPNVEPEFLIPALNHLNQSDAQCLIVEASAGEGDDRLLGLLPLNQGRVYGLPLKSVVGWKHDQCYDTTPLVHRDYGAEVFSAMFEFLADQGYGLLKLDTMSAEANVAQPLLEAVDQPGRSLFVADAFERAAFRPAENAEQYKLENMSKNLRKKAKQRLRRLEEIGEVVFENGDDQSDYSELAQQFLDLEKSSWKGKNGTALASQAGSKQFFLDSMERMAQSGKAKFISLKLDGKSIAMIMNIESGSHIFAFKTAFDEAMSKYSPGVLVEIHGLERMHAQGIVYADSCTMPDNTTMNRIWGQKAKFQTVVVGLRKGTPALATKALPLMQAVIRNVRELKTRVRKG